jgi:hypothetical protein
MMGREKNNGPEYHDQDSEPSLNAPGEAGPTGVDDEQDGTAEEEN